MDDYTHSTIKRKFEAIVPFLNEKAIRLWCATEAQAYGYGGITLVSRATNVSQTTIRRGIKELKQKKAKQEKKIREPGGGRKKITSINQILINDLKSIIDNGSKVINWTEKSVQQITNSLNFKGHEVSSRTINRILKNIGYLVQRKEQNFCAQCKHVEKKVLEAQEMLIPVLYLEVTQKNVKNVTPRSQVTANTKRLLQNIQSKKGYTELIVNGLYLWGEHYQQLVQNRSHLMLITHASYIKQQTYWLDALQNFAKKQNICLNVHLLGTGIKKWLLPMQKMTVLYPEVCYNNKMIQESVRVNFTHETKIDSALTIIHNKNRISFTKLSKNIEYNRFLSDWNYDVIHEDVNLI
ncbi:hypothetical protein [Candidatus Uabimicrobium sp. HlEnr_7]|uniref:ISAzo13-like element transposase-related protein n=1 Tax=Candidatus Uabimicrobium helgolandensis TaxID=3095367 RepID=UPI00355881F0